MDADNDSVADHFVMESFIPTVFSKRVEGCDKSLYWLIRFLAATIEFSAIIDYIPACDEMTVKFLTDNLLIIGCELERA